jgi:arabinogalactan oligomer/maltooligosaccharide transport system permease protein
LSSENPFIQVLILILGLGAGIAAVEAWLWCMLRRWDRAWFWAAALGVPLVVLVAPAGLAEPEVDYSLNWLSALSLLAAAGFFKFYWRGRLANPILMMVPAFGLIAALIVYPFFFQLRLSFANLNLYSIAAWLQGGDLKWVGLDNYRAVFTNAEVEDSFRAFLSADFWVLLYRTVIWTLINVVFHVGFGLALAILLNREIRFKGWYRMLLIVPWAMPQVVAVLAWRGEFHPEFGMINQVINQIGLAGVQWWSDPLPIFVSCCLVNIWLGIPFMLIVFLGGLGSIPKSYYEAASIDGASVWTQFRQITLPMLKPVVVPSVTLGTIWTFNNVNVIYLMTGQDGGTESADILVSALYKSAFTYQRYSYAAAFAMVIFLILTAITLGWFKVSKGTES